MNELQQLRESFSHDRFAAEAGIRIDDAAPGYALCSMPIEERHCNARGTVMGGAIFTLADFASAVAANYGATDKNIITLHGDITYLAPAKGSTLIAEAHCVKHGRTTTLHTVELRDELGTQVAHAGMNGFAVPAK